jgi:hypothetical protein
MFGSLYVKVRVSRGSTAFHLLPFVVTAGARGARSKSNTGIQGFRYRYRAGWPGPAGAGTRFEMEKPRSRAGGTAGAAVPPKTPDPTSWEVELPWSPHGPA